MIVFWLLFMIEDEDNIHIHIFKYFIMQTFCPSLWASSVYLQDNYMYDTLKM